MCVHMWEPWEWAGVSGVDVFSPPESEKLYLAHTAWHRGLHHSNQREIPRGMSMRNVEFPELEHTPRPKRRKRESAFAVSKNRSLSVAHTAWSVRLHGVVQSSKPV